MSFKLRLLYNTARTKWVDSKLQKKSEWLCFQVEGLFERRLKGRNIAALQETIEEIGFRGDQEEEEDVFAIAEDNRRKRREAAEDADAVEEDEVIKSATAILHLIFRSQREYSFVAKQICYSMQNRKREDVTDITSIRYNKKSVNSVNEQSVIVSKYHLHMLNCKLNSTNEGTFSNSAEKLVKFFFFFIGT